MKMVKYPRTLHLEGSRLQPGDEDLDSVPFATIRGRHIVVEEKVDGANAGIRFDDTGRAWLQSRGHFLTGGVREKHFNLFKQWAHTLQADLWERLGEVYTVYGEWLYARHTVYYDALPHYFLEFDILDSESGLFLATPERRQLLDGLPVLSVPVLYEGPATTLDDLLALIGPSAFKTTRWRERLSAEASDLGLDIGKALSETDGSDLMEGLYIKVEENGQVVERYKWVRADFLTVIRDAATHWLRRPIIPNRLAEGAQLFGGM